MTAARIRGAGRPLRGGVLGPALIALWAAAGILAGHGSAVASERPQSDFPPAAAAAGPSPLDPFDSAPLLQAERLRGLRPEIVRRMVRGEPGGEIALAVLACPQPTAAESTRVALFVEIDGATFLGSNQSRTAQVELYAYALRETGAVAGHLAESFSLDVARHGETVWKGGLRFVGWLQLPVGGYELRVLVHNAGSLAQGLTSTRLEVPAPAADRPALLPPLFAGSRVLDTWLSVRGRGGWQPSGEPPYPFVVAGRAFLPAALPVLISGRAATAFLLADRLPQSEVKGWLELLADRTGDGSASGPSPVVAKAPLEPAGPAQETGGLALQPLRFLTPAAAAGRYLLRLRLSSPAGPVSTPSHQVLVAEAATQDREFTWNDLKALHGSAPPMVPLVAEAAPAPAPDPFRRPRRRGLKRLAADYREALAASLVADATRPAALVDLELHALARLGNEPLARLRNAELLVAAELGNRQTDLLLPLIALHDQLLRLYRGRHLFSLVTHSRRLLEALAESYAQLGGEARVTADVLASLGGYMQELRAAGEARRLFDRALVHDPTHPPALLGLAVSYEKHGSYAQATARLESLVAARPELAEARLRLALNLERTGDLARFRELLRDLAASGDADWVSAVACEELARSLLEAGAPQEAAAILERATERMPDRQALRILLAHVYDRQGRLKRSWQSLEQAAASTRTDRASERLTYDAWENSPLEGARQALRRDAGRFRAPLLAALPATEDEP